MRQFKAAPFVLLAVLAFFAANRAAYKGFFSGDDLDNITWTRELPARDFLTALLSPRYYVNHFRPAGHAAFAALAHTAGAKFPWYVGVVHLLHISTSALLGLLLLRLGFTSGASACGAAFFLLQMALFDAIWKPMYLFDVWCALFLTAALSAWIGERWLLALGLMWLAIKAKEHAVMFAGVVFLYELIFGRRRWKPVAAAGAIAALFALQGFVENREQGKAYQMAFSVPALIQTLSFYTSRVLIWPYLGFLLVPAAWWSRDRRAWWGLAAAGLLLAPMLFLPGRMFSAYLYVPMLGIAIVIASCVERADWRVTAGFAVIWLVIGYLHLRQERRTELASAADNRAYYEGVERFARDYPSLRSFIYSGYPAGLQAWGVSGAIRLAYHRLDLNIASADQPEADRALDSGPAGILSWNPVRRAVSTSVRKDKARNESFLDVADAPPVWQFGEGWYDVEGAYRWIKPKASVRLHKPDGATAFEVRVNIGETFISRVRKSTLRILVDGRQIGEAEFTDSGWRTARIALDATRAADVSVEFHASPEFRPDNDPRVLGIAIGSFGFR